MLDRLETADDGRIVWSSLTEADLAETGADRAHSEGIIDLLSQAESAEVAILFKEAGASTRISVRTRSGGVDATVLTGRFGGGGHARAAGATVDASLAEARPAVLAEATRLVGRREPLGMARSSLGPGLDGILVVAKPAGPTSHDVVALVRRLAATRRVGHGGTLDPFAPGVLPVFLGHATRVVEYHLGDRKAYRATVCFGASSTTDDLEGELTPSPGGAPSREAVLEAMTGLTGSISQRPPAFSAIKVAGRRAYAMARAGEAVVLAEREVTIHELTLVSWDGSDPDRPVGGRRGGLLGGDLRPCPGSRPRANAWAAPPTSGR